MADDRLLPATTRIISIRPLVPDQRALTLGISPHTSVFIVSSFRPQNVAPSQLYVYGGRRKQLHT